MGGGRCLGGARGCDHRDGEDARAMGEFVDEVRAIFVEYRRMRTSDSKCSKQISPRNLGWGDWRLKLLCVVPINIPVAKTTLLEVEYGFLCLYGVLEVVWTAVVHYGTFVSNASITHVEWKAD